MPAPRRSSTERASQQGEITPTPAAPQPNPQPAPQPVSAPQAQTSSASRPSKRTRDQRRPRGDPEELPGSSDDESSSDSSTPTTRPSRRRRVGSVVPEPVGLDQFDPPINNLWEDSTRKNRFGGMVCAFVSGADADTLEYFKRLVLPDMNGDFEAGIAADSDPSIADHEKLRIDPRYGKTMNGSAFLTAADLYDRLKSSGNYTESDLKWLTAAAFAVTKCGLLGYTGSIVSPVPDGDWVTAQLRVPSNATKTAVTAILRQATMKACTTLAIATKVNWFSSNHHTGVGGLSGYALKVANNIYDRYKDEMGEPNRASVMHTIGHWCSTRVILSDISIDQGLLIHNDLIPTTRMFGPRPIAAIDVTIRLTGMPAGRARLGLLFAMLARFARSGLLPLFPERQAIEAAVRDYEEVILHPFRYHIGHRYLVDNDEVQAVDDTHGIFGRMISYIKNMMPHSSISKSPHIKSGPTWRDIDNEDYDRNFDNLLRGLATSTPSTADGDVISAIAGALGTVPVCDASDPALERVYKMLRVPMGDVSQLANVTKMLSKRKLALEDAEPDE